MKYIFITFLSIATAFTAKAQTLINQKDPITGKQLKSALINIGVGTPTAGQKLGFTKSDGKLYLSFVWLANGTSGEAFKTFELQKNSLIIKADNDSIMRFKPDLNLSKISVTNYISSFSLTTEIDNATLEFFKAHKLSVIRIGTNGDEGIDSRYKEKTKIEIQKGAAFMLDN